MSRRISPQTLLLFVGALLVAALFVISCGKKGGGGNGPLISNYASLRPDNLTLTQCSLELAGSKYKAEIQQKREGAQIQIDLSAFGQVIESERYESTEEAFSVVNIGLEECVPPINLIRYGMHIGDSWTWTGNIKTGPELHKTTAKITTSSEDLMVSGWSLPNVVRVDVNLSIDSGRPTEPSMRKLQFWIAPNKGVIKRNYANYSTREPLGE